MVESIDTELKPNNVTAAIKLNDFEYGALFSASLFICTLSIILNVRIMYIYFKNKEIQSGRIRFCLNIALVDLINTICITLATVIAASQKSLGFNGEGYYCMGRGLILVPCFRNIRWTLMIYLARERSLQIRNYNPTGKISISSSSFSLFLIWSLGIVFGSAPVISVGPIMKFDYSCCVIIYWYKPEWWVEQGYLLVTEIGINVVGYSIILFYHFGTLCSVVAYPSKYTRKDTSRISLFIITSLYFFSNLPFMIEQYGYILTNKTIFGYRITIITFLISQLSFLWNPILYFHNTEQIIRLNCRGLYFPPAPNVPDVPEPAEEAEEAEDGILWRYIRWTCGRLALNVNRLRTHRNIQYISPDMSANFNTSAIEEMAENVAAHQQENIELQPMPAPVNPRRQGIVDDLNAIVPESALPQM